MPAATRLMLPDGRVHEIRESCTFGRHAGNDVALDDDHVSRQHALIQWQQNPHSPSGGSYLFVDLGSSNGSYINGNRVTRPIALQDGDVIEMGGNRIGFQSDEEAGSPASETIGSTAIDIRKRNIWLMVADIVGSTRMSQELPPEEVPRIHGNWFKACRETVESHGGHMNQYLGDGFFCYWEDTLAAQRQLQELLRHFAAVQENSTPAFRLVLHFGLTVLGSVPTLSSLNLHGPSVNFVFRMEKLAGSLGEPMLLSGEAARVLGFRPRTVHQAELAGFDGVHTFVAPVFDG